MFTAAPARLVLPPADRRPRPGGLLPIEAISRVAVRAVSPPELHPARSHHNGDRYAARALKACGTQGQPASTRQAVQFRGIGWAGPAKRPPGQSPPATSSVAPVTY